MRIQKVRVEGFRLLEDVEILFEPTTTVVVGRNNSGKTSLTEVFDRFIGERETRFRLEDFSAGIRGRFALARQRRAQGADPEDVLAILPAIAVTLTFSYDMDEADLGPLSPFIIDLDVASTTAIARIEYAASPASVGVLLDVPVLEDGEEDTRSFNRHLRQVLPRTFETRLVAIDPTDAANVRLFDKTAPLTALLQCGFVRAQRTLDHSRQGETDVIGKLLTTLFQTASSANADPNDQTLVADLKASVDGVERGIQTGFDQTLRRLLPALRVFGFPSLNDTQLRPETSLDVESLLSDHTKIFYEGSDGVHLPEGYNGLGTRNLIYMLLQLESFHKAYRARAPRPGIHLVYIEEPEAHLHPQMQEVFINQLNNAVLELSRNYPGEPVWPVQFVVSTHSPHVANAASFEAVRYFLSAPPADGVRQTKVKDFRRGAITIPEADRDFLHQYMTLTKCDLYFADKAIMVEGTTERILMPRMCQFVDHGLADETKLGSQYITTVEVGGAYAHRFYPLLDFLELKTLIITDIDAVWLDTSKDKPRGVKCPCATEGAYTSNAAIKAWFAVPAGERLAIGDLQAKTEAEKRQGSRRITFQIAEVDEGPCARSFEDALVLANPRKFGLAEATAEAAWEMAQDMAKADTALQFAIVEQDWIVPRYIRDGLTWLSEPPPPPDEPPAVEDDPAPEAPTEIEGGAAA